MDVHDYLDRIGYAGSREPTAEVLRGLHVAHLRAVPFENLSIHADGEQVVLDEDALVDKIVRRRRGGFCYELNGAFAVLLRALGYQVDRLAARVFRADTGELGIPFDHMILLVHLEERWLVDVGFGEGPVAPLRFDERGEQSEVGRAFRIAPEPAGDQWNLCERSGDDDERKRYQFSLTPFELADYEPGCRYHTTDPQSPFLKHRLCSIARATGRVTLSGDKIIFTSAYGMRVEFPLPDTASFHEHLRFQFGIQL